MRRDRALAEDFARRHGVPAFYDDAAALIADPQVDAVYIAAPPGSHLELGLLVVLVVIGDWVYGAIFRREVAGVGHAPTAQMVREPFPAVG